MFWPTLFDYIMLKTGQDWMIQLFSTIWTGFLSSVYLVFIPIVGMKSNCYIFSFKGVKMMAGC